jgi:hypothetical protein
MMNQCFSLNRALALILIFSNLLFVSCGYISDKPPENLDVYRSEQLQACKVDIDKLGEIFKQNQEKQIKCLMENFIQYTRYVKSSSPDTVNQNEIGDFVKKIFQGQSDQVIKGLSIIFQLNMILLRDEAQKISKGNITPLFNLLVTANREAIIITQSIQDIGKVENQARFFELRDTFSAALLRFTNATIAIMNSKQGKDQSLNIKEFIIDTAKKLGNKDIDQNTIDTFISLKQMFVSGQKEVITSKELEILLVKIPKFLTLTFDVYYADHNNFKNDAEQAKFYLEDLNILKNVILFDQKDFELFKIDQIIKLAKDYLKNSTINFTKFKPSISALKKRIIGGNAEGINLSDLKVILELSIELNEKTYFDYITYNIRKTLMQSDKQITYDQLSPIDLSEYQILKPEQIRRYTVDFNQMAVQFKYFRKDAKSYSYYGPEFKRSKYGFIESSIIRWLTNKMLKAYGKNRFGEFQVNLDEFQLFLNEMRPILEELKLWSPTPETFARNAILLADLFQAQSNGDQLVNEKEATEYIEMILTAASLGENLKKPMNGYCDGGLNVEDPMFEVKCFNEHFYETFLNQLKYKDYFPKLDEYVNSSSKEEALAYLKGIEGFARDINDPKIPINKRDTILTLGSIINVETTFLRFDTNNDNIIDYNELMEAFKIYKQSIILLAKLKPEQEAYAPSIFLYMVSKMEVPPNQNWIDNLKFYSFHKCLQYTYCREKVLDKIEAKRLNIGTLLYYMVNSTPVPAMTKPKK